MLNINDAVYDELGDVLDSMIETGGMSKEEQDITLHRATRRYKQATYFNVVGGEELSLFNLY